MNNEHHSLYICNTNEQYTPATKTRYKGVQKQAHKISES